MLVEVFTAGRELLRSSKLEVPQFVLHSGTELVRVAFPFRVELHTDGCVLKEVGFFISNRHYYGYWTLERQKR